MASRCYWMTSWCHENYTCNFLFLYVPWLFWSLRSQLNEIWVKLRLCLWTPVTSLRLQMNATHPDTNYRQLWCRDTKQPVYLSMRQKSIRCQFNLQFIKSNKYASVTPDWSALRNSINIWINWEFSLDNLWKHCCQLMLEWTGLYSQLTCMLNLLSTSVPAKRCLVVDFEAGFLQFSPLTRSK